MDYLSFERRLLRLMFRTNAPLTPVHVAYYIDIPISEARTHLDHMVALGILELDSDEGGHLIYSYPMRPSLSSLPEPRSPRRKKKKPPPPPGLGGMAGTASSSPLPIGGVSLVATSESHDLVLVDRRYSPAAAAALSLFLPGVGQIYSGRVPQGVAWMLATGLGYLLFLVPGLILHICCIVNAAAVPTKTVQSSAVPAR
jgi:hypothetical protein